jgi:hypothetical protein
MREVNNAWEVLRSPARRAEYDARLRGDVPVWQKPDRAKRTVPVSPRVADLEPARPGTPAAASAGWRVGPVLAVVLLVVALLGFAAWATTASDDSTPSVQVEAGLPFEEDTCVLLASVEGRITPTPVGCSSVGAMWIDEIVDLGRPCSPATDAFDLDADEVRLCVRPAS